jgi:hypothetical protein
MIYVDDVGIPAKVWNKRTGRYVESRWYHLISDQIDTAELHAFASRLGLHRSYFQQGKALGGQVLDPGHDHYDVMVGKRKRAIALGAQPVDWQRLAEITMAKTQRYWAERSVDLSGRTCPACVHVLSEHEIITREVVQMKCLHPMCDCESRPVLKG